jgi:glycosyltransferase A (GT-A) superfamily protein (DUF2064 family)
MSQPAVVIMARAPRAGAVRRALEPTLGAVRCAALQAALTQRAAAWASEVAPGAVHVAYEPPDSGPELRGLLGPKVFLFPQNGEGIAGRLADVTTRVFGHIEGPILIVWPELARWRPEHASGALDDMRDGCDVTLGPVMGGGFYLIAIAKPLPSLFGLPEQAWRSPDVMSIALPAAVQAGLEVGILRTERGMHSPEDLRAALADPLLAGVIGGVVN